METSLIGIEVGAAVLAGLIAGEIMEGLNAFSKTDTPANSDSSVA